MITRSSRVRKELIFKIVETDSMLYLECNGGMDIGYGKPLQMDREVILKEFNKRVEYYGGKLIK